MAFLTKDDKKAFASAKTVLHLMQQGLCKVRVTDDSEETLLHLIYDRLQDVLSAMDELERSAK